MTTDNNKVDPNFGNTVKVHQHIPLVPGEIRATPVETCIDDFKRIVNRAYVAGMLVDVLPFGVLTRQKLYQDELSININSLWMVIHRDA